MRHLTGAVLASSSLLAMLTPVQALSGTRRLLSHRSQRTAASTNGDFEPGTETGPYRVHAIDHLASWVPGGGNADILNPLVMTDHLHESYFVDDNDAVLKSVVVNGNQLPSDPPPCFKRAGPRERIYFKPDEVVAAVVTCGGICPGLNTVLREVVSCLWDQYGVRNIWGIPGGYRGMYAGPGTSHNTWQAMTADSVNQIHTLGGTVLGTSRGGHDAGKIVDALAEAKVNQLYVIGGDGSMRGASKVAEEARRRKLRLSIIGIPKTVDNDIPIIDKSFGFETAVEEATKAIASAHVEAEAFPNGVGVVQLMGRNSGFIALHATLGSRDVDCVLIPEVDFEIEGEGGLLSYLEAKLAQQGHAVVVVAEGAGAELLAEAKAQGACLNEGEEIGPFLVGVIAEHFKGLAGTASKSEQEEEDSANGAEAALKASSKKSKLQSTQPASLKYINPTYMVRSVRSNAADNVYCTTLSHASVHASFAGRTNLMVGPINGHNACVPLRLVFGRTNVVAVEDEVWARALFSTGQPDFSASASLGECDVASDTAYGGCTVDLLTIPPP